MTTGTGIIVGASLSHRRATVGEIEAVCDETQREAVETLLTRTGVSEAFVLQTCNRAEAYVVAESETAGRDALAHYLAGVPVGTVDEFGHEESLRHLMRVACGLESLVLGEDQIIGQVRTAYEDARAAAGIGPMLDDAVLKALHVGERARTETAINEGIVSLGSAAVKLAAEERALDEATALVVGAGEMSTLAAKALAARVERVIVANRTIPHAAHVASELAVDASAVGLAALPIAVTESDIVISATGSDGYVLDADDLGAAGETLVIDLAQPRDIDPEVDEIDGVDVRDLDALEQVTKRTKAKRAEAAAAVEAMIDDEFEHLVSQYKRKRADQVIAAMYEGAERMKARELRTAVTKLENETDGELTDRERAIIESLADALVGQLLAAPTQSLRDAAENDDWSTINTALQLFDPGFQSEPPAGPGEKQLPQELRQRMPKAVLEQLVAEDD